MITVKDILRSGSSSTVVVSPTDTVYRALQLMAENNVGAVVVSKEGHMVGIFTERDYCRKIILMGRSSLNTPIGEIMTKNMITVQPNQPLEECLRTDDQVSYPPPACGGGRKAGRHCVHARRDGDDHRPSKRIALKDWRTTFLAMTTAASKC